MGRSTTTTVYTDLSLDEARSRLRSFLNLRTLDPASDIEGHFERDEFRMRSKKGGPFRSSLHGGLRDLGERREIETRLQAPFGSSVSSGLGLAGLLVSSIFLPPPWDDYGFFVFTVLIVAPGIASTFNNRQLAARQRELMQWLEADK